MTKEISKQESLVRTSAEGSVELSETELNKVTGGDKNKAPAPTKTDKQEFLTVELHDALITSYSPS